MNECRKIQSSGASDPTQERMSAHLSSLAEFAEVCVRSRQFPDVAAQAVELVATALAAQCAEVLECGADHQIPRTHALFGWPDGSLDSIAGCVEPGFVPRLAAASPVMVMNGPRFPYDNRHPLAGRPDGSTLAALIRLQDSTWGILAVHTATPGGFTSEDTAFARAIASLLAGALERLHTTATLETQVAATNLCNHQLLITDKAGHITFANHAFEEESGLLLKRILGKNLTAIKDWSPLLLPQLYEHVMSGGRWHGRWHRKRADKSVILEQVTAAPITGPNGEHTHVAIAICNTTACKLAEERLSSLTSNLPGWAYRALTYPKFQIDYIQRGTADILGWSERELKTQLETSFESVIASPSLTDIQKALASLGDNGSYHFILRVRSKLGDTRFVEARGRAFRNRNGIIEVVEGIAFDITEQVGKQEQLDQARRMRTVGSLTAGIAHDFNNLLQSISGYCLVLSENPSLDNQARQDLAEIERGSHRASSLVRRLMTVSRQAPSRMSLVDMVLLADEAVSLLRETIPRTIQIDFHASAAPILVLADPSQLNQVLMNLCLNARDAMPDGGSLSIEVRTISASHRAVRTIPGIPPGELCWCTITDTGCGMDDDTARRAVEPFFTTKPEGTGLGLSTCYGIVRSHGGRVAIKSDLNHGTEVSIFLPIADAKVSEKTPYHLTASTNGTETVLVVEDEDSIRRLTTRLLRSKGYNVVQAENGSRAIEIAASAESSVDLVLLDLNMPGIGGQKAIAALREHAPGARILVLTGMDTGVEVFSPAEQPDGLLQKPCRPEVLLRAIRRMLDTPLRPPPL